VDKIGQNNLPISDLHDAAIRPPALLEGHQAHARRARGVLLMARYQQGAGACCYFAE
jgi:hypothetical protein